MNTEIRERLSLELRPSTQEVQIKNFIAKNFNYDARSITNQSSLVALLLWLLDRADKHIRQDFIKEFSIDSVRVCDCCGGWMTEGYSISEGFMTFCSDKCLHKHISAEEYDKLYERDEAYWTSWDNGRVLRNWCMV